MNSNWIKEVSLWRPALIVVATLLFLSSISISKGEPIRNDQKKLNKIGVQLYTVRAEMEKDFEGTLRKIAALGFDEVEFAGLFGNDPAEVKTLLEELKLDPVASHVDWKVLKENPQKAIEETLKLGAEYMIIAWFPPETRDSKEDWEEWINLFNRVGKMCKDKGLKFAYHNHDYEFSEVDGVVPYDLLLEKLDRRYVVMEIDLYWLALGGAKPDEVLAKYPGGFHLAHVKDMSREGTEMVDVGDGQIDFAKVFGSAETAGLRHYIVEHDTAEQPFESLARSLEYLRKLEF